MWKKIFPILVTIVVWVGAVTVHGIYTMLYALGHPDEYGFGPKFQLMGFAITVFPFYLIAFLFVLTAELLFLFGMEKKSDRTS
jgi:hypothetical protein